MAGGSGEELRQDLVAWKHTDTSLVGVGRLDVTWGVGRGVEKIGSADLKVSGWNSPSCCKRRREEWGALLFAFGFWVRDGGR